MIKSKSPFKNTSLLLATFCFIAFVSCSKDKKYCWVCAISKTGTDVNGNTYSLLPSGVQFEYNNYCDKDQSEIADIQTKGTYAKDSANLIVNYTTLCNRQQ